MLTFREWQVGFYLLLLLPNVMMIFFFIIFYDLSPTLGQKYGCQQGRLFVSSRGKTTFIWMICITVTLDIIHGRSSSDCTMKTATMWWPRRRSVRYPPSSLSLNLPPSLTPELSTSSKRWTRLTWTSKLH